MATRTTTGSMARLYKNLQRNMSKAANAAMRQTMQYAKETAKETTSFQDRTGQLRRSIQAGLTEEATPSMPVVVGALSAGYPEFGYKNTVGKFISTELYAPIVELGTKTAIGAIFPINRKALGHRGSKGHPEFGPVANVKEHPGVNPHPFIWPTMMQIAAQNVLGQTLEAALASLYP